MADTIDLRGLTDDEVDLVKGLAEMLRRRHRSQPPGGDDERDEQKWGTMAAAAFAQDWDNERDAIYDDWRERYRVPER